MGIRITMDNVKIMDHSSVCCNAKIRGDADIQVTNVTASGNSSLLEGLSVDDVCDSVAQATGLMTAEEARSFRQVAKLRNGSEQQFMQALAKHVLNFAEGVVAGIVSSKLTP